MTPLRELGHEAIDSLHSHRFQTQCRKPLFVPAFQKPGEKGEVSRPRFAWFSKIEVEEGVQVPKSRDAVIADDRVDVSVWGGTWGREIAPGLSPEIGFFQVDLASIL